MEFPESSRISAEQLRELLDRGPLGYQSLTADGRIEHVNDAWLGLLGYARDEVQGRWIGDFVVPGDREALAERFPRFLVEGEVRRLEFRLARRDGSVLHVEVDGRIEYDDEGRPRRTHCLLHDVTDLRQSQDQLRHLFEGAPVCLWAEDFSAVKAYLDELRARGVTDADAYFRAHPDELTMIAELVRVIDVNEAAVALHRASTKEELIGSIAATFTERSLAGFRREVVALFEGRHTSTVESEVRTLDGEVRPVLARMLVDPQFPDWSLAYVAITDLTESRRAAEAQALLTTAVEQADEIIMVTDPRGIIRYVNPAFTRITGYARAEAVGRDVAFLLSERSPAADVADVWRALREGRVWSGPVINRRKDGTSYEEEATISPVRDDAGDIVACVAVKRDVTHERELERQLQQSQKLEAIGHLAGGIAHDFNNILQTMIASLEFAADESQPPDARLEDLGLLRQAVGRASELTRRLLAFSRGQTLDLVPVDVDELIAGQQDMMRRLLPESIALRFEGGAAGARVLADPGQLEQVLVNLYLNARDAMPDGGTITVATGLADVDREVASAHPWAEPGRYVTVAIRDTGCGMNPELSARIFEPFFTTKEKGRGTGLGLAVVYGLVKQHGGFVRVRSAEGAGATFTLHFPVREGDPAGDVERAREDGARGGDETVLVAEDDPMVLSSVRRLLERAGYTVVTARDGAEAVALVADDPDRFDLALLDMIMPNLGGREAAARIGELAPATTILFSTGYSEELERLAADGAAPDVLRKPYDGDVLLDRVRAVLDRR